MSLAPLLNAIAAAAVYGGWAAYANSEHPTMVWLRAAIVQGSTSFGITLTITLLALYAYKRAGQGRRGIAIGWLISATMMAIIPSLLHMAAGTPNILHTILPGLIIGSVYLFTYLLIAERKHLACKAAEIH